MSAVTDISSIAHIDCPDELRQLEGWLIWRFEQHDGEPKPRKVPYYANGAKRHGVNGQPSDRAQLVTFEAARAAAAKRGFDGVGLALMPDFGIVALDFDNCVGPEGVRRDVLELVQGTYAEFSPSGRGVRAFFVGNLGNHKDHGAPFGFEVFSSSGYVTLTGHALPHVEGLDLVGPAVAPVTDAVKALCAKRFGRRSAGAGDDDPLMTHSPPLGLTESQLLEALDVLDPDMPHGPWLAVGMALHHETGGERFDLWDEWSSGAGSYPSTEALLKRWESFGKGGGKVVTARSLVKLANEQGAHINVTVNLGDFDVVEPEPAEPRKPPKFELVQAAQFAAGTPPGWIVKGVLPRAELVVIYGESGAGKTFAVLDLVAAIARGVEWRGNRVTKGRVIYVAAEGAGGLRNRLAAYARHHDLDLADIELYVIQAAPNLLDKADALDLARAIAALGPASVIVIDTLAQTTPGGNENAAEDMGKAMAHCKGIHRSTGALVLLVHHAGKDSSKGARGWSGLRAAADAELEVVRMPTARVLRVTKQKDGDDHGQWAFDLQDIPLGMDDDGDIVGSCAVIEAPMPVIGSAAKPMGRVETIVNQVIQEFATAQVTGIELDAVVTEAARRLPEPEDGKRDQRKKSARRALTSLCTGDEAPYFLEDDNTISVG